MSPIRPMVVPPELVEDVNKFAATDEAGLQKIITTADAKQDVVALLKERAKIADQLAYLAAQIGTLEEQIKAARGTEALAAELVLRNIKVAQATEAARKAKV